MNTPVGFMLICWKFPKLGGHPRVLGPFENSNKLPSIPGPSAMVRCVHQNLGNKIYDPSWLSPKIYNSSSFIWGNYTDVEMYGFFFPITVVTSPTFSNTFRKSLRSIHWLLLSQRELYLTCRKRTKVWEKETGYKVRVCLLSTSHCCDLLGT